MQKKREIIITVRVGNGRGYRFNLLVHQAQNASELRLPVDFYKDTKLEFPLYEVQILDPVVPRGETGKLNYHFSDKDNEPYVCYPSPITTEEKLMSVLKVWAVGQVCVKTFDRYLNEMLTEAGGSDNFLAWAEKPKQQNIHLIGVV